MKMPSLEVRHFGPIGHTKVEFGDLTVLVGHQASGKSLLLQLWKLALDAGEIVQAFRSAGLFLTTSQDLLDAYFGEGMRTAWTSRTKVLVNGKPLQLKSLLHAPPKVPRVFFVPAHRALLIGGGWPAPFSSLNSDTPAVARLFSQSLYDQFTRGGATDLFPIERRLETSLLELIDEAVFHRGRVVLRKSGLATRLKLEYGKTQLPFMTWTAGQREFTPLLLGLYQVLPPRRERKDPDIEWVIIEEPEMGLHPQALSAFMALVLDLLWRGYRVVISTHSPFVLDVVFAMRSLQGSRDAVRLLREAFELPSTKEVREFLGEALTKTTRTFFLEFNEKGDKVQSLDITSLDPGSEDPSVANWGGLTGFSGKFGDAIARGVMEREG